MKVKKKIDVKSLQIHLFRDPLSKKKVVLEQCLSSLQCTTAQTCGSILIKFDISWNFFHNLKFGEVARRKNKEFSIFQNMLQRF